MLYDVIIKTTEGKEMCLIFKFPKDIDVEKYLKAVLKNNFNDKFKLVSYKQGITYYKNVFKQGIIYYKNV